MRIFVAFSLLFLTMLNGQTPFQRADAIVNSKTHIVAGRLDCQGFIDHARKAIHGVCTDLAEQRVVWEGDMVAPKSGRTFTGFEIGTGRVQWSITRDGAGLTWAAVSSEEGSPTYSGTL